MSLLDGGPDEIDIYPQIKIVDDRGNEIWVPSDTPVTIRCRVQPSTVEEDAVIGQQVSSNYRVITRDAPAGPWARVVWRNRNWGVVGEPRRYNGSPRTRHVDFIITAQGVE